MESEIAEKRYTLLEALIKLAPKFQKAVPLDVSVTVTDTEKILVSYSAEKGKKITNNLSPESYYGQPIKKESGTYKAIQTGEFQETIYPKELYGVKFKNFSVPIEDDNGKVIGCMAVGMSLSYQERLMEAVQTLASASEEIIASTEELASSAQVLAEGINTIDVLRMEMDEQVNKTDLLLKIIKQVASNSNLLGLNASIEAARAGNEGRGFGVVAAEIRKMADNSSKSAEEIKQILEDMRKKMSRISEEIPRALEHSQQQAMASKEISDAILTLNSHISSIEEIAKTL